MSTPENPFDSTIWEPGGEHAIEDPLHGPSAVHEMLETPPMPLGDGTYYQPGASYAVGTPYFDVKGEPIYRIGVARSTSAVMREALAVTEWAEAAREGEEALTALEARRQRERLEQTGVTFAFKPSDVCAGGQRLDECGTAQTMISAAQERAAIMTEQRPGEGTMWTTFARLGKACTACALQCEVAVQTQDGVPTGVTRFANSRPLEGDVITIRLDI
jgi:hypothetical protein